MSEEFNESDSQIGIAQDKKEEEFREPRKIDYELEVFSKFPQLRLPKISTADDYYFDEDAAFDAVTFFINELEHVEGPDRGKKIDLEPWQQYIIEQIFGWKDKESHLRRFREVFIFIARKNGKTLIASGLALYALYALNEPAPRVVCAAGEKEQAALLYETAKAMVEENERLGEGCYTLKRTMALPALNGNFQVLSADAKTKHGRNLSCIIIDELHTQPNRDLVDVLFTSVGARLEPLKVMLTTAGHDTNSVCYEYYQHAKQVIAGTLEIEDPEFFPVIFELDEDDDWNDESLWYKANPNIGVAVTREYLRSEYRKAKTRPTYENTFKQLHLNIWTEQSVRWVPIEVWNQCEADIEEEDFIGQDCILGVDLSSKTDITAVVALFPDYDDQNNVKKMSVIPYFWIPKNRLKVGSEKDKKANYEAWAKAGHITLVNGATIKYGEIRAKIQELGNKFNITKIAYDPWNALHLMDLLEDEDGFSTIEISQTPKYLSGPTKELEAFCLSGKLQHNGNPVMKWMFGNIVIKTDDNGNIRFSKGKSGKIDGMSALVTGMHSVIRREVKKASIYESRGVRVA